MTSATGFPRRVIRRCWRVFLTSSIRPRHLALNSEMEISFIDPDLSDDLYGNHSHLLSQLGQNASVRSRRISTLREFRGTGSEGRRGRGMCELSSCLRRNSTIAALVLAGSGGCRSLFPDSRRANWLPRNRREWLPFNS